MYGKINIFSQRVYVCHKFRGRIYRLTYVAEQFLDNDVDNEISLLAFRLLVMDLLVLFHVVNEGVINVLGKIVGAPGERLLTTITRCLRALL